MGIFNRKKITDKETKNKARRQAPPEKTKDDKRQTKDNEVKQSMKDLYAETPNVKAEVSKIGEKKNDHDKYSGAYKILIKPLITEKASTAGTLNKYLFQVADKANKIEIAKAIKQIYGVAPVKVNVIKVLGKETRYGRSKGKRKDWKKAVITLPEGQTIKVYEGV